MPLPEGLAFSLHRVPWDNHSLVIELVTDDTKQVMASVLMLFGEIDETEYDDDGDYEAGGIGDCAFQAQTYESRVKLFKLQNKLPAELEWLKEGMKWRE